MNESHRRFNDWLTAGAEGDPPRDAAVHASVCAACQQAIAALDELLSVNTGLASAPAEPTGREHGPLLLAGRLIGATAVLFSAAILGVGVSQLIGMSHGTGPVAQASATPDQNVLGGTATPEPSPEVTPTPQATPRETLTPLDTPVPTHPRPVATPIPRRTAAPTPLATPIPSATGLPSDSPTPTPVPTATPTPIPSVTPIPTATPVPTATATPTATPLPQCSDGIDNDLDGFTDFAGGDPQCTSPSDNDESVL